jgi:hypothetical protein
MSKLGTCVLEATGSNPKEGWRDALILACDDAELEYDELVAALKDVLRIVHEDYGLRFFLKPEVVRARKALGGWGPNQALAEDWDLDKTRWGCRYE